MSDHEFDNYIALLGRALRLSPAQRDAIADELRDHMEQRLAELTERGVDREHALTIALEEFGDANALAGQFTEINHHQHRRQLMRYTLTTVTAACLIILVTMSILPERRDVPIGPSAAAARDEPATKDAATAPVAASQGADRRETSKQMMRLRAEIDDLTYALGIADLKVESEQIAAKRVALDIKMEEADFANHLKLAQKNLVSEGESRRAELKMELARLAQDEARIAVKRAELDRDRIKTRLDRMKKYAEHLSSGKLAPGDMLLVSVFELVQPGADAVYRQRIDVFGKVRLPVVGEIEAAEKTPAQVREELIEALDGIIRNPSVRVEMIDEPVAIQQHAAP